MHPLEAAKANTAAPTSQKPLSTVTRCEVLNYCNFLYYLILCFDFTYFSLKVFKKVFGIYRLVSIIYAIYKVNRFFSNLYIWGKNHFTGAFMEYLNIESRLGFIQIITKKMKMIYSHYVKWINCNNNIRLNMY